MPFILGIIGLFAPRCVIFLLWIASGWFTGVFETRIIPLLGFFLLPFTLLWYSVTVNWFNGEWNWWQVLVLVCAVVADLSSGNASRK